MRKYTISDNIISALLGIAIAIPICIYARNEREKMDIEPIRIEEESVHYIDLSNVEQEDEELAIVEINTIAEDKLEEVAPEVTEVSAVDLGEFRITAYCPCEKCCGAWADGITASGTVATEGRTIAVDPDVIPLGSIVEINGIQYIAEDTGGSIKENRIDIFFNSHDDALEWGVQYIDVSIISDNFFN